MKQPKTMKLAEIAAIGKDGNPNGTYKVIFHFNGSFNPFHVTFTWTAADGEILSDGYRLRRKHVKTIEKYADYKSCICCIFSRL